MNQPRAKLKVSFRTKVLVPVVVWMILFLTVISYVANRRLARQFQLEARRTLATADAVFKNSQQVRIKNLGLRFHSLPNDPRYLAAFKQGDIQPLHRLLAGLLREQGVDMVFYTTGNATVLADERRDPAISPAAFETAAAPAVKLALQGSEKAGTIRVGERLYDVASVPVYDGGVLIGALTLGSEIGRAEAQEFSLLTHSQIALLADGRVVASTVSGPGVDAQILDLYASPESGNEAVRAAASLKPVVLNDEHYFGIAGRFESLTGDQSTGYVLFSPYEQSLLAFQATQRILLGICVGSVLLGVLIVWWLVSKATHSLFELRDSAEAVGRGDFTRRVEIRSRDECGELAAVFNQMTDNLRQSRAQLEQTVETLKNTQAQLIQSEKLSAVGGFVAGVAHELNNPLTAVMGFSEILKDADVGEQHQRYLNMIFEAAKRCQKIVQSLLSFARRQPVERRPADVNKLIEAVLEIVSYPLRTSNIEVVLRLDPALPAVFADGHQIQQVLLNVINNARQAVESHQAGGKITITTGIRQANVCITIQDNGPGISESNLRSIFDPFFTTKEIGKGTGLGLSLCYGIIKEHGGHITPSSRPGEGATFVIELPVAGDVNTAADTTVFPAPDKPDPQEGAGKKILVIDDEEPILQMISEALKKHGYGVDLASDGGTGLRLLGQHRYDATLCDWKMPGLNGWQVYERLRKTDPGQCRRLIFVTGDVINEQMRALLEREKCPSLIKPFTLTDVLAAIRAVTASA